MTDMTELKDEELTGIAGGMRSLDDHPTVHILTQALHAAEIFVGREHELYSQIQKCIDTFYEGWLIRDEVQIATNMLLAMEDNGMRNNIIAGLQEALAAHGEA